MKNRISGRKVFMHTFSVLCKLDFEKGTSVNDADVKEALSSLLSNAQFNFKIPS